MSINLAAFYMGRDIEFADQLTGEIQKNAIETVARVNRLLALGGFVAYDQVNSGWRPPAVNDATSNSGKNSRHLYGQAVDVGDASRELAKWVYTHQDFLAETGLWCEHPDWTWSRHGNHWVHFQTVPPGSGRRVFIPFAGTPPAPYEYRMETLTA